MNTGLSLRLQVAKGRWETELGIGSSFVSIFLLICLIPLESEFIIFPITRGSQAECHFALVINLSLYGFGFRKISSNDVMTKLQLMSSILMLSLGALFGFQATL